MSAQEYNLIEIIGRGATATVRFFFPTLSSSSGHILMMSKQKKKKRRRSSTLLGRCSTSSSTMWQPHVLCVCTLCSRSFSLRRPFDRRGWSGDAIPEQEASKFRRQSAYSVIFFLSPRRRFCSFFFLFFSFVSFFFVLFLFLPRRPCPIFFSLTSTPSASLSPPPI